MTETESKTASSVPASADSSPFPLPRVTIRFCTQCKWMLRAAYVSLDVPHGRPVSVASFLVSYSGRE